MSGDGDIVIEDTSGRLTDEQRAEIKEGVLWVKDWLEKRQEGGSFLDFDALGFDINKASEYREAMSRIKDLKVIVTDDLFKSVEDALNSGQFHLKEEVIREFGSKEDALLAFAFVNEGKKRDSTSTDMLARSVSSYIEEPVIFLNVGKFEEKKKEGYAPSLSSVVAHEVTHTLNLNLSEAMTKEVFQDYLREGVAFDPYLDNEKEIYARVMQFRKDFNLDPNKEYDVDEVARLRQKAQKDGNDGGYILFDRYEDAQISGWLNFTSQTNTDTRSKEKGMPQKIDYMDFRQEMKNEFLTLAPRIKGYFNSKSFENAISFVRESGKQVAEMTAGAMRFIKDKYNHRS